MQPPLVHPVIRHPAYQLVIGAALSVHRDLFDRLGGDDPTIRTHVGEDWEQGHRALTPGANLPWLDEARVCPGRVPCSSRTRPLLVGDVFPCLSGTFGPRALVQD